MCVRVLAVDFVLSNSSCLLHIKSIIRRQWSEHIWLCYFFSAPSHIHHTLRPHFRALSLFSRSLNLKLYHHCTTNMCFSFYFYVYDVKHFEYARDLHNYMRRIDDCCLHADCFECGYIISYWISIIQFSPKEIRMLIWMAQGSVHNSFIFFSSSSNNEKGVSGQSWPLPTIIIRKCCI